VLDLAVVAIEGFIKRTTNQLEKGEDSVLDILEYLFKRLKAERPVTHKVGGIDYAVKQDGTLGEAVRDLAPQWTKPTLAVGSLNALVAAYNAGLDGFQQDGVALHVVDELTVDLISIAADEFGQRHVWVRAKHKAETPFAFATWYEPERFLIAFRSSFLYNDNAVKVQQVCSTVGSGDVVAVADDGVSQEITVKAGTVTRSQVSLPAEGIPLIPWRTFREAAPVESKFLLRMKGVKDALPQIALFEIDAKWRLDTIAAISRFLNEQIPAATIIS
jgi:hypothetical protein